MKNKTNYVFLLMVLFVTILLVAMALLSFFYFDMDEPRKIVLTIIMGLMGITVSSSLFLSYVLIKKKREDIKRSFDYYIEKQISHTGAGLIICNEDLDIIWASKFIETRLGKSIIGKKFLYVSQELSDKFLAGEKEFKFSIEGIVYEAHLNLETKSVLLKDITKEQMIIQQYMSEKLVIGEIEIDNFQHFQLILPEDEIFKIQSAIIKMLDGLVEKYNLVYRQYVNGKYIIFTNQESLKGLIKENFSFLDQIRVTKTIEGVNLSISIGFGSGSSSQKELTEFARDGLRQSQARGGDQVCLVAPDKLPEYFGSKIEIAKSISRVKIKQTAKLFESKISSADIKNVIIYGHKTADLDAIGAAMGIAAIAKRFKKPWLIQNVTYDSSTTMALNVLFKNKDNWNNFIKPSKANILTTKSTLIVIVDTADLNRIENENALKKADLDNVFIFDHHRTLKAPKDIPSSNVYIDTTASSASEIVTEITQFIDAVVKISKTQAQMLLNGIYLDTKSFSKSVSYRTFNAASFLEERGAKSSKSIEILKIPENSSKLISYIVNSLEEVKPGYFMAAYEGEADSDVISIAADEILRTQGRKAAFVIAKIPGKNMFKMSARGNETNVQLIAESVGGGGHFGAAAAISSESLSVFGDNIKQAIVSRRDEK